MRTSTLPIAALIALLGFSGCEGPRVVQTSTRDARSAWVRVTSTGLQEIPQLLAPSSFQIGFREIRDESTVVCPGGGCRARVVPYAATASVSGRGTGDQSLDLRVVAGLQTDSFGVTYEERWPCAMLDVPRCAMTVDTARVDPRGIAARGNLGLRIDPTTGLVTVGSSELELLAGIDGGDVTVQGTNACGQVWCTLANVANVTETIAERGNEGMVSNARQAIEALTCRPCSQGCATGSICQDGICVRRAGPEAGHCDPRPVGMRFQVPENSSEAIRFDIAFADALSRNRGGIESAVRVTSSPLSENPCVPDLPLPSATPIPEGAFDRISDGNAHLVLLLAQSAIERAFWAAHQGGVACMEVDASDGFDLGTVLPLSNRASALGLEGGFAKVRPRALAQFELNGDSARVTLPELVVELGASVAGRPLVLASGTLRASMRLDFAAGEDGVTLRFSDVDIETVEIRSRPILSSDPEEARPTFQVLQGLVRATIPNELTLPLPGNLSLASAPQVEEFGSGSNLVRGVVIPLRIERTGDVETTR